MDHMVFRVVAILVTKYISWKYYLSFRNIIYYLENIIHYLENIIYRNIIYHLGNITHYIIDFIVLLLTQLLIEENWRDDISGDDWWEIKCKHFFLDKNLDYTWNIHNLRSHCAQDPILFCSELYSVKRLKS